MNHLIHSPFFVPVSMILFIVAIVVMHFLADREAVKMRLSDAKKIVKSIMVQSRWDERLRFMGDTTTEFVFLVLKSEKTMPQENENEGKQEVSLESPTTNLIPGVNYPLTVEHLEAHHQEIQDKVARLDEKHHQTKIKLANLAPYLFISQDDLPEYLIWVKVKIGMNERHSTVYYSCEIPPSQYFSVRALVVALKENGFFVTKQSTKEQPDLTELVSREE